MNGSKDINKINAERENDHQKNWRDVQELLKSETLVKLGDYYSYAVNTDIKHLLFTLSRYKFASKMIAYMENIRLLELGCNEALGALMFDQNNDLARYVGIDMDENAIRWNREHLARHFEFICGDFFEGGGIKTIDEDFDVVVSLDVIEHIQTEMEDAYCEIISRNLKKNGTAIIGTPSIMMSPYASEGSKLAHINLYDQKRLYELMKRYFHNVYIFNMNDEVVNTGFSPMSCYIFALCCNKK